MLLIIYTTGQKTSLLIPGTQNRGMARLEEKDQGNEFTAIGKPTFS
jgi:hypothetical protein